MAANALPSVNTKTYGGLDFRASQELKSGIHRYLLNQVDLERISAAPDDRKRSQLFAVIQDVVSNLKVPLSGPEKERLSIDILDEVFGLGPLEPLMQDPDISNILINGAKEVYVERAGILEETKIVFKDDAHLMRVINKIVSAIGRRVDESSPMVDARLADGSRVNVILPPLAIDGPHLSIRRFGHTPITESDLLSKADLKCVHARVTEGCGRCPTHGPGAVTSEDKNGTRTRKPLLNAGKTIGNTSDSLNKYVSDPET
jgi:hypothetical protein